MVTKEGITSATKVNLAILGSLITIGCFGAWWASAFNSNLIDVGETLVEVKHAVEKNTESGNGRDQAIAILRTTLDMLQRQNERLEARVMKLEGR